MFSAGPSLVPLEGNIYISVDASFIYHDSGVLPLRKNHLSIDITGKITVNDNVFIGMNAYILPAVTIGNNCDIRTCALVNKDMPANSMAGVNPAKVIKSTEDYIKNCIENSLENGRLVGSEKVKT